MHSKGRQLGLERSTAVLGMLLNRRVVAHCVFATEACMLGGTFSSALLGSLLDDAIGVSAALSFPVVLAAIASLLMGLLAGTCLANSRIGSWSRAERSWQGLDACSCVNG